MGQVQRARRQVHHQSGGVRQASAGLHRPDHRRPDHSAQSRVPGHPGTFPLPREIHPFTLVSGINGVCRM